MKPILWSPNPNCEHPECVAAQKSLKSILHVLVSKVCIHVPKIESKELHFPVPLPLGCRHVTGSANWVHLCKSLSRSQLSGDKWFQESEWLWGQEWSTTLQSSQGRATLVTAQAAAPLACQSSQVCFRKLFLITQPRICDSHSSEYP